MITVIICSIYPERCNRLLENISETIGTEYETIVFDNRDARWGLCRVYNHCAEKARFPCLCFMHEDLHFGTKNWGQKIIETMERISGCGVTGFAGGLQACKNFTSWWAGQTRMNVYDGFNGTNHADLKQNYTHHHYANPDAEEFSKVLCVDGLFQCVRKSIWEEIKYDEDSFPGFHFYDVDFSFAVAEKYNNYVLLNFDVFHDSHGSRNLEYVQNMFIFQNKWKSKLPESINNVLERGKNNTGKELREAFTAFKLCVKEHVSLKKYLMQIYRINRFGFFVLTLFYLPIKTIPELFRRTVKKYQRA